jgi:hypothetical protein
MTTNVGAKKRSGVVLIVVGVLLLVVAGLPDVAGISADGFGLDRMILLGVATLVVLTGVRLTRKKGHYTEPPS